MRRFSGLWWSSILLSSVVTGGGSFVLLNLVTGLPIETIILVSLALIVIGDLMLVFIMESISPTRILLGPGERRHRKDTPELLGTVVNDFENGSGAVSIRGEQWLARQSTGCDERLAVGSPVRVLERNGLTLVVAAA